MEDKSSGDKLVSGSLPMLGPESSSLDFRSWFNGMSAVINSVSEFNLLVDPAPGVPLGGVEIAQLANANQRRVEEARREEWLQWQKGQKRASALLLTAVAQNKNAQNLLEGQRSAVVPVLRAGENLLIAEMMTHLQQHYIPINALRAIKTEQAVKDIKLKRNEPLTKFLVRFEDAINNATAQGKVYTLLEKRSMLDSALKSGEKVMETLVTSLQLQIGDMTWVQIVSYLSQFDDTALGSARLVPDKPKSSRLDTIAAIDRKKKSCDHCGKPNHTPEKCWQLHPELIPKKIKEMRKKKGAKKRKEADSKEPDKSGKKARKSWPALAEEEDSASLIDCLDELLHVGEEDADSDWIFLDSCASRLLFLLRSRDLIKNYRKCRRLLGTAHAKGSLWIRGEGHVAGEAVDHCPELRRSILSLGRVHSWGLTAKLPPDSAPLLVDGADVAILRGEYRLSMPCFCLSEVCDLLLSLSSQESEVIMINSDAEDDVSMFDMVAAVTRSMDKPEGRPLFLPPHVRNDAARDAGFQSDHPHVDDVRGAEGGASIAAETSGQAVSTGASRHLGIWEGDKSTKLPQRALTDPEKMTLLHLRMGHIFVQKLTDGYVRMRYSGYTIPRSMLAKKAANKLPKCSACYRSKQRRRHMHPSSDLITKFRTGECIWLDIHVFLNMVGYDGTAYRANFSDMASGFTLSYGLQSKDQLVDCFPLVLEEYHIRNELSWKYLYSDQESAALSEKAKQWLRDHRNIEFVSSPTDTPEMNGPAEGVNRVLGSMTLAMLHHSGREVEFWPAAYDYAVQIKFVMPAFTAKGYMSPFEYLTGRAPNISHFRVWGSTCFVLEPRSEHRKDWHPRSVVGFFLKLSGSPAGYSVWVPELHGPVVSVNVEFDEAIPDPGVEYHRALEESVVPVAEEELSVSELKKRYLGKHFVEEDNGLLYRVVGIRTLRDRTIVADVMLEGGKKKNRSPLHVADMMRMVDEPKNSEAAARALQEAIDIQQTREENSPSYRDSLILLEDTCKGVDPRVEHTTDIAPVRSVSIADNTLLSGVSSCCSIASGETKEGGHCCDESDFEDTGDGVALVTDALVAAMEAADLEGKYNMCDAPRDRHAMLRLPAELKEQFLAAEEKELSSIQEREVVESECPIPKGVKLIDSRMVYSWKDPVAQAGNSDAKPARMAKARMVMKDFKNRADDLRETFAPTGKGVTFRLIMLLCTLLIMQCDHIDVNTAFLYADLVSPLYMNPPTGFPCRPGHCWKIVKALYGCRTAPREWYKVLRLFVISLGFMQTVLDPCLFYYGAGDMFMLIYFYVDDILLFTKYGTEYGARLKEKFFSRFKCKDLGRVKRFLGVWVEQSPDFDSLCLHQRPYCEQIVEKYGSWWSSVYPTAKKTPLPQNVQERLAKEEPEPGCGTKWFDWWNTFPYLQMIGAALYLAINTRPDIIFAVCMLARFSKLKSVAACKALCWMYSYLSGSVSIGIKYCNFSGLSFAECLDLFGFSDADWASDLRSRRSTAGFIVFACGGPLAWGSKLMATIAASSMESEYMAAYFLGQMLLFIRNVLGELGFKLTKPTPFFMDAMSAVQSLKNPVFHARTKHIDIKWHWLRQHIGSNFSLYHVRTVDMSADLLTKMAVFRVWCSLLPHILGEEVRSSTEIIAAQSREKGADFPRGGVEKP